MLFHFSWTRRDGVGEEGDRRILEILETFEPAEGQTIHAWVELVDGNGGYGLIETDDASVLASGPPIFTPFFEFDIQAVVQHDESVELLKAAVAARG
jgi:hypothetical protein